MPCKIVRIIGGMESRLEDNAPVGPAGACHGLQDGGDGQIGQHIGFDPVDAGPLTKAQWLETLGYLNIQLGYMVKMGTDIGFALLR